MSGLGKRYIAVLEPVGGNSDTDRWIDLELHTEVAGANTAHEKFTHPTAHHVATYEIDLTDALPINPEPTDEQRAMHAERMALHWTAEFDRLAPCLGGHPPRESEAVRADNGYDLTEPDQLEAYRAVAAMARREARTDYQRACVAFVDELIRDAVAKRIEIGAPLPSRCPCGIRPMHEEWCDGGK